MNGSVFVVVVESGRECVRECVVSVLVVYWRMCVWGGGLLMAISMDRTVVVVAVVVFVTCMSSDVRVRGHVI